MGSWLCLIPPLIVLLVAFRTKNLHLSLIIGIVAAAFIATHGSLSATFKIIALRFYEQITNRDSLYTYLFLCAIGSIVALLEYTGITRAFTHLIGKKMNSPLSVQLTSIGLSSLLAIDDYLSTLTTGYVIRPLADRVAVARVKLAFLLHAFSGPLVILVPLSSWAGYITGQLSLAGIGLEQATSYITGSTFTTYLLALPFTLYSFATIASVLFIIFKHISYGPMKQYEQETQRTKTAESLTNDTAFGNAGAVDFFVIIGTFTICAFAGFLFTHGQYSSSFLLCSAGIFALIIGIIFARAKKQIDLWAIPAICCSGIHLMMFAICMVFLASTFGSMLKADLFVGNYIAQLMTGKLTLSLFPASLFLIAIAMATITGSSWGTIAIMLPIAIPLLIEITGTQTPISIYQLPLLFPTLGALFSGAVCGDHLSPISETTVMAATSARCSPIEHVHTQFFYAIPSVVATLFAFALVGFFSSYSLGIQAFILISTATLTSCALLYGIHTILNKK